MKSLRLVTLTLIFYLPLSFAAEDQWHKKASETFAALEKENKFVDNLTYSDLNVLPVGWKQTVGNQQFSIAISNIRLLETHAELTVFARMRIPQENLTLFFGGQGIKYSYSGSFIGDASLVLLDDIEIPINGCSKLVLKGGFDGESGRGDGKTYVTMECLGFKELSVCGEIQFSDSVLVQVNASNKPVNKPVTASFQTVIHDWNDWLMDITLPPFQVRGLDGFVFQVQKATFDFSDYRNSQVTFPTGYKKKYLTIGHEELWRGVFIKDFSLVFPEVFSSKEGRPSVEAHNLLIDDNGISGEFKASNVLPIEFGDASGWAFSVDDFMLAMEAHQITEAGFAGQIALPLSEKGTRLDYEAVIGFGNKYAMKVLLKDSLDFDCWSAKAVLKKNSYIQLEVLDGKFKPEACLNGYLDIRAPIGSSGKSVTKLENIEFNGLVLRTEIPYLQIGSLGYKGDINLFGFPVTVSKINLSTTGNKAKLGFDLWLNLDEKFVSASTGLEIAAEYKSKNGKYFWVGEGLNLSAVKIKNNDIGGIMTLDGSLEFMDDHSTYGSGFSGEIDLKFKKVVEGLSFSAATAFGKKNDFRYWFVDGLVGLPGTGIPVAAPINLTGFGGGLSYAMKKTSSKGLGISKTGCGYLPDSSMGLGLKAAVMFGTTSRSIAGDASFEIAFNRHGGLDFVGFYGYMEFLANISALGDLQNKIAGEFNKLVDLEADFVNKNRDAMDQLARWKQFSPNEAARVLTDSESKARKANMAASLGIQYDVSAKTLHANFDFYMNVAGGLVRGVGSGNRAGQAILHVSPSQWYLHMGRPDDRIGLEVGIPGLATVRSDSYFMMGNEMPGSPPPPEEVSDILKEKNESLDYMRDFNALQAARGLAFGSSWKVKTGDLQFLILYANFNAGMGFDIMLRDYGNIQCQGRNGPVGINGWYANGQGYAYLDGELGVKVNLWFIKGKFPIIKGATAALLQAQLPNPLWVRGNMGVSFNLLGGLAKGNMRFKFTLGEKCDLQYPGSSPVDLMMISDLTPVDRTQGLDVFTAPQLTLNAAEQKEFTVTEEDTRSYRIRLNEFNVYEGDRKIPGIIRWNEGKDVATFVSHDVLPPNKELQLKVKVGFEEKIDGAWKTVYTAGQVSEEKREITFTTGTAPDYIPLTNIQYAYPFVDQHYYFPGEFSSGFITLRRGQPYLFADRWKFKSRIVQEKTVVSETDYIYNEATRTVSFSLPKLAVGKTYGLSLQAVGEGTGSLEGGASKQVNLLDEDDSQLTQTLKTAENVTLSAGKELLAYGFSSSRYETFSKKIAEYGRNSQTLFDKIESLYLRMRQEVLKEIELFEDFELKGTPGMPPMISAVPLPEDRYYREIIYPLLYEKYPYSPENNYRKDFLATPLSNQVPVYLWTNYLPYSYDLPYHYYLDFHRIRALAKDRLPGHPLYNQQMGFPILQGGKYKIHLQYTLPGGKEKGTSATFTYNYERNEN